MLQRAAGRARAASVTLRLVEADATRLPFAAGTFDAVVSRHLLWALSDPELAFCEWIVATDVGGVVVWFDAVWPDWVAFGRTASGRLYLALGRAKAAIRRSVHPTSQRQNATCGYDESLAGGFPFRGLTSATPVLDVLKRIGVEEVTLKYLPPFTLLGAIRTLGLPVKPQERYYSGRFRVAEDVHSAALLLVADPKRQPTSLRPPS
jgi:SAM-dependent methyltransferase